MTNATQAFSYRSRAAALPSSTLEAHRRVSRVPEPRDAGIEQCAPDAATAVRRQHRHAELGDVLGHEPVAGLRCRDDASPRGTARLALVGGATTPRSVGRCQPCRWCAYLGSVRISSRVTRVCATTARLGRAGGAGCHSRSGFSGGSRRSSLVVGAAGR